MMHLELEGRGEMAGTGASEVALLCKSSRLIRSALADSVAVMSTMPPSRASQSASSDARVKVLEARLSEKEAELDRLRTGSSSSLRRGERIQGAITAKQYAAQHLSQLNHIVATAINKAFDERLSDPLLFVAEQLMPAAEAELGSMRDG